MDLETLALQIQRVEDRSTRNEGRIKALESDNEVLHSLATSVAVMGEQMKTMNASIDRMNDKVDVLEKKPGKRWDTVVDKLIWAVLGAMVAFVLANFGM